MKTKLIFLLTFTLLGSITAMAQSLSSTPGFTQIESGRIERNELVIPSLAADQPKIINFSIYPNPINDAFRLNFMALETGDLDIRITNLAGKEIISDTEKNFSGVYQKTIDLGGIESGIYLVIIKQNNKLIVKRLLKSA